jgi:hypothetical protein
MLGCELVIIAVKDGKIGQKMRDEALLARYSIEIHIRKVELLIHFLQFG